MIGRRERTLVMAQFGWSQTRIFVPIAFSLEMRLHIVKKGEGKKRKPESRHPV